MEHILVETPSGSYPIYIKENFDGLLETAWANGTGGKACIVTDRNVSKIYASEIKRLFSALYAEVSVYEFDPGEKNKNLGTISDVYDFLLQNKIDRKTLIAGLGGGVAGDMAGFAAATYMRGIPFVQIPTSLLAQVDSSVGGKVGVDFKNSKNIVGAFYQPRYVYINTKTLETLPKREFSSGMAEVIKYGPIYSRDFYEYLKKNVEGIKEHKKEVLENMIGICCQIKAAVVSQDEKETGLREILNFGHTIGHAIETLKEFDLLHGECVALGMVAAMYLSCQKGYVPQEEVEELKKLLTAFDLPVSVSGLSAEDIYRQMFLDKKVKNNQIGFVLIQSIGRAIRTTELSKEELLDGIEYVLE